MKRIVAALILPTLALAMAAPVCTLISKGAARFPNAAALPASSPAPQKNAAVHRLTFTGNAIHITAQAGPKANMMSFDIAGMTNPELRIPRGATVTLTVANVDDDMLHNLYITPLAPPYAQQPRLPAASFGTVALTPHKSGPLAAGVLQFIAATPGTVYYVCTVPGHAKQGMFGKITVTP